MSADRQVFTYSVPRVSYVSEQFGAVIVGFPLTLFVCAALAGASKFHPWMILAAIVATLLFILLIERVRATIETIQVDTNQITIKFWRKKILIATADVAELQYDPEEDTGDFDRTCWIVMSDGTEHKIPPKTEAFLFLKDAIPRVSATAKLRARKR